ncbi:MAG: SDR family oxidoreductase [Hyphomicrobiaceae bacterium]
MVADHTEHRHVRKTACVLGGYGLIGAACARALSQSGFVIIGVGRSETSARQVQADIGWRILDLAEASVEQLRHAVAGADVVVNAAGALQDGLQDNVIAIHETMVARLVAALEGTTTRVVQISAAGVSPNSSTEFFRSKARGDALLMASRLDWVVLRPSLVLAREAYGGTALLRASAAVPLVRLQVLGQSRIETVSIDDVTAAVVSAARGEIAGGTVADLTEPGSHSLDDVVRSVRSWLGLPPWRTAIRVPDAMVGLLAKLADALGYLGWRSPLRSTAIRVLSEGIHGDPRPWQDAGGDCRPLAETLAAMPATPQDRWYARLYLMLPAIVGTLALFWLSSGVIGFIQFDEAARILTERGVARPTAAFLVLGGACLDMLLGAGILFRRSARSAALAMAGMSLLYLLGGTLLAADLWGDPLGPLLKVLPVLALALVAAAIVGER